jgi:hypothetical protein
MMNLKGVLEGWLNPTGDEDDSVSSQELSSTETTTVHHFT